MRRYNKLISILLVALMMTALIAACGGNEAKKEATTTTATTTAAAEETTPTPEVPAEPVELTVINSAGGTPAFGTGDPVLENNPVAQELLKKLNIKIKWEILTGDGKQQMGLKLASGDYSDMIIKLAPDIYSKMLADKMLLPLGPEIEKSGPNIKQAYGEKTLNFLKEEDGNIYHLTEGYGNIPEGSTPPGYGFGFQIRKDIYEAIGSPKLDTLEDVYNVLKMIKADSKVNKSSKGVSVWPISTFKRSWYNMIQGLEAMGGSGTSKWIVKDGKVQYWFRAPWAVEIIKFYNRIYREGLLDQESFVIDPDAWQKNKVNTGRVASTIGSWYMVADAWGQFKAAGLPNADNMWFMNFPVSVPNGDTPQLVGISSTGVGTTVVTDKCKNLEAAIKLLDYLASPEGNFTAWNGAEGTQWEMKDGKPVIKDEYLKRWAAGEGDDKFAAETGLGLYRGFVGTDVGRSPWGTYWVLKDDPALTNRPDFVQRDTALGEYFYDSAPFSGIESGIPQDITMMYSTIDGKLNDAVYEPVLADSEAAAIEKWQKFIKDMDAAGAAQVEEAVTVNYQKNLEKLGK
jgi:putative aldouronate transport system substrate-binding protein